jgi:hypothetical protein
MFTITSSGSISTTGKRSVQSTGVLRVSASRGSFSDYLMLTDQFRTASNGTVYFTSSDLFDGRVHTNDAFKFAYHPVFQDRVTQGGAMATYYNNGGSPVVVDANNNGAIDTPDFFGGYLRAQPTIAMPTNANDQQCVALGLSASGGVAPTGTQINAALFAGGGGPSPGGYVVNDEVSLGGGVEGPSVEASTSRHRNRVRVFADTVTDRQYYQSVSDPITARSRSTAPRTRRESGTTSAWVARPITFTAVFRTA